MTLDRGATTAGEEPEALIDERGDLAGVHAHDPCRGELDCERNAVEAAADLGDRGRVRRIEFETGARGASTVDEERRRVTPRDVVRRVGGLGQRQRAQRPHLLAVDRESLAARRENANLRASAHHTIREPARGVEEVLAVVEYEQELFGAEELNDARFERHAGSRRHAERGCDDLNCFLVVVRHAQLAQPCAVAVVIDGVRSGLQREPGLADAPGTSDGHEPHLAQRVGDVDHRLLAADERRDLRWEIARNRVERSGRLELAGQAGAGQLEDSLGTSEVAQAMLAQVDESQTIVERVAGELFGRE